MPIPLAQTAQQEGIEVASTARAYSLPHVLQLWHLASLDAPTVAVVWSLAFARAARISLPFWVPILLALGTWTVYVGDRLLDARAGMKTLGLDQLRERHFFHWRHRRGFVPLAILAAIVVVAMIFTLMPAVNREENSMLAAVALAYFSGVHGPRRIPRWLRRVFTKELLVGTLFTAGCALPTLSRLEASGLAFYLQFPLLAALGLFAALAWLNCHAIDRWECNDDKSLTGMVASILASLGLCAAARWADTEQHIAAMLLAGSLSAGLLGLLHLKRARFSALSLRAAADLVLLVPLILGLR